MRELSTRQKKILDFISNFIEKKGYAPSVRDVAGGCGISSASVTQYHLNILEREGYIRRDRDISRSIGLVKRSSGLITVPLLGSIAAGQPIPVPAADAWVSTPEEILELPPYLSSASEKTYALRVKGTSMLDALIGDGDIVLMQQANTAENGDMVAAWLKDEGEVTLKRLYRESGKIRLQPANEQVAPIYVEPDGLEVQGRVIGVIRKL